MKKMFRRHLELILSIGMVCSLLIGFFLQIKMLQRDADTASDWLFWQIQQMLTENQVESQQAKEEYRAQCLLRANAAAYIIQSSDTDLSDQAEMTRIAELLQVDELHIFDTGGTIIAGSEPKYFGYHFNSGEQMQFFLPMLADRGLELCQDVTPNTAEGKLMQYAAVLREDGAGIVQIGVTPARVLAAMEKTELSYIFSLLTGGGQTELCAADPDTYTILGSTNDAFLGRSLTELGFSSQQLAGVARRLAAASARSKQYTNTVSIFRVPVEGTNCYCVFTSVNGLLLGRFCEEQALYAPAYQNMLLLAALMLAIFLLMLLSISHYLDRKILRGIAAINGKLQNIADGQLDETVDVSTTPEFSQLSWYINHMVKSILSTTVKLSSVFSAVQLPIAIYEYGRRMERVSFTSKLPEILGLSAEDADRLLRDRTGFEQQLAALRAHPVSGNIFRLPGSERYVKLEESTDDSGFFGILVDVTADMAEKKRLEHERDVDLLTDLLNRRAFYARMDALFRRPEQLKHAALLMIDTDDLKNVNDRFGHEAGDQYLRDMAHILRTCTAPNRMAARLSGDEFVLLIYGCAEPETLRRQVAELEAQRGTAGAVSGSQPPSVRFSMGTALYSTDSTDYHVLLKLADQRMYEDKRLRKTPKR